MEYKEYVRKTLKIDQPRKQRATLINQYEDLIPLMRKVGGIYNIKRSVMIKILNDCFAAIADNMFDKGCIYRLPMHLGRLFIHKYNRTVYKCSDGIRVKSCVNWDKTLKLWFKDKEAERRKIVVKYDLNTPDYGLCYVDTGRVSSNLKYYDVEPIRSFKYRIKEYVEKDKIIAYEHK